VSFWLAVVELVRGVLFASAHFLGGSIGGGILAVSLLTRIALIPWTLPAARRAKEHRDAKSSPPFSGVTLAQLPIGTAMYQAIKRGVTGEFLWVRDLARPDVGLAIVAAAVTALATKFTATDKQTVGMLVGAAITFAIISHLSSGVALYSIAWSGIGAAESWIAGRKK
jgi:membrane protein insertase Oxa1/YidC/SpoIIIJ